MVAYSVVTCSRKAGVVSQHAARQQQSTSTHEEDSDERVQDLGADQALEVLLSMWTSKRLVLQDES